MCLRGGRCLERREDDSPGMKVCAKLETWTRGKDLIRRKFAGEDTVVSMSWRLREQNLRVPGSLLLYALCRLCCCCAITRVSLSRQNSSGAFRW